MGSCTPSPNTFNGLIRASRRGEASNNFSPTGAPGSHGWGEAYDTPNNATSFGSWNNPSYFPLKNTGGVALNYTGRPATDFYPGATLVQIGDPASALYSVTGMNPDYHYTSTMAVTGIFGPGDLHGGAVGPSQWVGTVVAGPYLSNFSMPFGNFLAGTSTTTYPAPFLTSPPQPCIGGNCDTDGKTYSNAGNVASYSDSVAPYATLTSTGNWGLVTGTVVDGSNPNKVLSGVPVVVFDAYNAFTPVEKITDANGNFMILVPANGTLTVSVNDPTPKGTNNPNTSDTHYYDPWHGSAVPPLPWNGQPQQNPSVDWSTVMSNPGTSNVIPLGTITLPPIPPFQGSLATISGTVTAKENSSVLLSSITLTLRDSQGGILETVYTDIAGNYAFQNLPSDQYYVVPVLVSGQAATPNKTPILLNQGQNQAANFTVAGVKSTVKVAGAQPGTLVVLGPHGTLTSVPPMYSAGSSNYSKVTGDDGTATLQVAPDQPYDLKCWAPNSQGVYTYGNSGTLSVTSPDPTLTVQASCPVTHQ